MNNLLLLEPIPSPTEVAMQIAMREKAMRKSRRFTQADLASRSQVSLGSIRRFEQSGQVSLESFIRICQALGCDGNLDGLFGKPAYRTTDDVIAAQRKARYAEKRERDS